MVAKRITELISAWQAFLKSARAAHSQTGKSIGSQFWECRRLRYGFGKLSRSDYYDYRLFDDALTFADKQRFVGFDTGFHINATLNKATWKVFADDKLLFYAACQGLEIPVPVLQGVFDVRRRRFGDVPVIATETELLMFLRERRASLRRASLLRAKPPPMTLPTALTPVLQEHAEQMELGDDRGGDEEKCERGDNRCGHGTAPEEVWGVNAMTVAGGPGGSISAASRRRAAASSGHQAGTYSGAMSCGDGASRGIAMRV